jgi:sugar/nucleoside kinase (ribokinase family)
MPRFDVTVVGELNLDLILYGVPEELPFERELLANGLKLTLGSSSAIVAHNLAVLGARVGFVSTIGDDPLGQIALERLTAAGVDVSKVKKILGQTTGLTVILTHPSRRHIFTYPGTMFDLRFEDFDLAFLTAARHFHMSSFFLHRGLRPRMLDLFRNLKSTGLSISLDTNDDPEGQWQGVDDVLPFVDVLLPNEAETKQLASKQDLNEALDELARRVPVVAVKLGSRGAIARRGEEKFTAPAVTVNAVDPVGAGDSFDAGFLFQYLRGGDLKACLEYGNLAGALSTTKPGGTEAFREHEHVRKFFHQHRAQWFIS